MNMRRASVAGALAALVVFGAACTSRKPKSGCPGIEVALVLAEDAVPTNGIAVETRAWQGKTVRLQRIDCYRVEDVGVIRDVGYGCQVSFKIVPSEARRFEDWTRANLRSAVAMLVQSEVVTIATINSPLPGAGILAGEGAGWTKSQAEGIAELLAD